jgi:hypothetical protein
LELQKPDQNGLGSAERRSQSLLSFNSTDTNEAHGICHQSWKNVTKTIVIAKRFRQIPEILTR